MKRSGCDTRPGIRVINVTYTLAIVLCYWKRLRETISMKVKQKLRAHYLKLVHPPTCCILDIYSIFFLSFSKTALEERCKSGLDERGWLDSVASMLHR